LTLSMRRLLSAVLSAAVALALVGCGYGSSNPTATRSGVDFEVEVGSTIEVPEGAPSKRLVISDLKTGMGATAKSGDEVEFQYVAAVYKTGKVFSIAVPRAPYHLKLDTQEGIEGWQKGLVGMKVGGRRELIVPPDLAYGSEGVPPYLPPRSTVVFLIGLVGVK
jgi:peptidylprolyl isomerase